MTEPTTLIFLHIPKTAGTTFNSLLSWQYRGQPSAWISYADPQCRGFHDLPCAERQSLRLIRGHIHFGLHEFIDRPCTYATVLRDPAARVISYYLNQRREADLHPDSDEWWCRTVREMDLRDLILLGRDTELENGQVRRISGVGGRPSACTRDDLGLAKENLERHFAVAGLTEQFDETVALAARRLGWKRPLVYRPEKVGRQASERRRIETDPATLEAIREANVLDADLYRYAARRFRQQVDGGGCSFSARVRWLRLRNRCLGPVVPLARLIVKRRRRPGGAERHDQ